VENKQADDDKAEKHVTLTSGTLLSHYRVIEKIGAGGMGEVYRAQDTRLGRDVAIKVLSPYLAATPEVRARFEREARTISQLNHPHICTLYDIGHHDGMDYLVMELLDGETLADRLQKGPLPVAEVLSVGAEIAEALDVAHRRGIVHRDLKPGNVMLTKSGATLMDFGLARASVIVSGTTGDTESPTVSRPLTAKGTIVGTFQYMAPEQLEGKEADARTDIWALGCVLYEMATGKQAFEGTSQASLISAIMKDEPRRITELAPLTPPALERLVRQCLAKDPDDRWQSAADLGRELRWLADASSQAGVPAAVAARRRVMSQLAWVLVVVLGIAAATLGVWQLRRPVERPPAVILDINLPDGVRQPRTPALSPDGRWLVFAAFDSTDRCRLWLRPVGGREVRSLPNTECSSGRVTPFWSPDSRSIAFFAKGKLMRMSLEGGTPQALCDASDPRGGCWGEDGMILFAPGSQGPIFRVPAAGGAPVAVTQVDSTRDEISHRYPCLLPDGRHFLYVSVGIGPDRHGTWVGSLDGSAPRHLLDASTIAVYAPPGHVVFRRQQALMAQAFDPSSMQLKGEPRTLLTDALSYQLGGQNFSPSGNGLLVCATGQLSRGRLYWYDRTGRETGAASGLLPFGGAYSLSPDGRQALYVTSDISGATQLWLVDLRSGLGTTLTFGDAGANGRLWSPDGSKVYFAVRPAGRDEIHSLSLDGSEGEKVVFRPATLLCLLTACTPDGNHLVVALPGQSGRWELWLVPTSGAGDAQCLLSGPFNVQRADVSPDGRWLAYASDESGQYEIYVTSFPVPGARHRVSSEGGNAPVWLRGGRELLFETPPDRIMVADVSTETGFSAGMPHELFRSPGSTISLVAARDGNRFLLSLPGEGELRQNLTMLANWQNAEAK
jgi:Tol biopolymer transport system component